MKIVLACGGTGGHTFPAISVQEELKARDSGVKIVYVCGKMDIENAIFRAIRGEKLYSVESAPFRGARSLASPAFLVKLLRGFWQSLGILRREKPRVVVGFGGHFSFPMIVAARCLGIPTLIHEQNAVPGIANKVLARWVNGVALSFAEARLHLKTVSPTRVTGNPIRSSIERDCHENALGFFGFSAERRTVLVLGGSQGAQSINAVFLEMLSNMPESWKEQLQFLHLCGKMQPREVEMLFKSRNVMGRAYSFFDRMDLVYSAANVAVGRAGATFLAEIAVKNIPAVLVPFPFGGGHQLENARAFGRAHPAAVILQENLNAETLWACLEDFLKHPNPEPQTRAVSAESGNENSRVKLADFILELGRR